MLTQVTIVYVLQSDRSEEHTLVYSSQLRADCEYKAIRFICQSPMVEVISITFKEEL